MTKGPDHPVPPINFNKLEEKFINKKKGYEMHTTSKLLKEQMINGHDLDKFKDKYWKIAS